MATLSIDLYHLSLEPEMEDEKLVSVHATATNVSDSSRKVTATLNPAKAYDLLEFAYGGEQEITLLQFEQLESGQPLAFMATGEDCCKFSVEELIGFGFDANRLQAVHEALSRSVA
jgi:hypothetical protein